MRSPRRRSRPSTSVSSSLLFSSVRLCVCYGSLLTRTHTDRVGFEPTVPLRAHRFSRPAVSTAHAPVHSCLLSPSLTRIGWDSNPRNGYPFTRSPGVCLQPLGHLSTLLDAQTRRRTDRRTDA